MGVTEVKSNDWLDCAECGMRVHKNEYHPYAACLMFKACRNSKTVNANLDAVLEFAQSNENNEGRIAPKETKND